MSEFKGTRCDCCYQVVDRTDAFKLGDTFNVKLRTGVVVGGYNLETTVPVSIGPEFQSDKDICRGCQKKLGEKILQAMGGGA